MQARRSHGGMSHTPPPVASRHYERKWNRVIAQHKLIQEHTRSKGPDPVYSPRSSTQSLVDGSKIVGHLEHVHHKRPTEDIAYRDGPTPQIEFYSPRPHIAQDV